MRWSPWLASWLEHRTTRRDLDRHRRQLDALEARLTEAHTEVAAAAEQLVDLEPHLAVRVQGVTHYTSPHGVSARVEVEAAVRREEEYAAWRRVVGRRLELVGEGLVVDVLEVQEVRTTIDLPGLGVRPEEWERIAGPTYWTVELRALTRSEAEVERWTGLVGATVFVEPA